MKVQPAQQEQLLAVQNLDTARAQLAHRRDNLPEHVELKRLAGALAEAESVRAKQQGEVAELDRQIQAVETEIDGVRGRATRDQTRMDAGAISSPKELESLQHEVRTLATRQVELEDRELEFMEEREAVAKQLAATDATLAELNRDHAAATERRDAALALLSADDADAAAKRAALLEQLPAELVNLYEQIRERGGGVGAALLKAKRCGGCRLEISGTELAQVLTAATDDVIRCEECGRILIRTSESGL